MLPDSRPMRLFEFSYFRSHIPGNNRPNFNEYLESLAGLAMPEAWDFPNSPNFGAHEILKNYILNTFTRLEEENKIYFANGVNAKGIATEFACFNTGLLHKDSTEELYFFFEANTHPNAQSKWYCLGVGTISDKRFRSIVSHFQGKLPPMADFIGNDYQNLVMNPNAEITPNYVHFNEHPDRLPHILQQMDASMRATFIDGAIRLAKKHLIRNYRYAVPMYYLEQKRLQLLLPLILSLTNDIGFALIIDKQKDGSYFASTILSFQQAYLNARLIAKPSEWLTLGSK